MDKETDNRLSAVESDIIEIMEDQCGHLDMIGKCQSQVERCYETMLDHNEQMIRSQKNIIDTGKLIYGAFEKLNETVDMLREQFSLEIELDPYLKSKLELIWEADDVTQETDANSGDE